MSTCTECGTNGATPLQHCVECNKDLCQHCHPETFKIAEDKVTTEVDGQAVDTQISRHKVCKTCMQKKRL